MRLVHRTICPSTPIFPSAPRPSPPLRSLIVPTTSHCHFFTSTLSSPPPPNLQHQDGRAVSLHSGRERRCVSPVDGTDSCTVNPNRIEVAVYPPSSPEPISVVLKKHSKMSRLRVSRLPTVSSTVLLLPTLPTYFCLHFTPTSPTALSPPTPPPRSSHPHA